MNLHKTNAQTKTTPLLIVTLCLLAQTASACRLLEVPVTATPIIITATSALPSETPAPTNTIIPSPVIAPAVILSRTPLFPTATKTPLPTLPPSQTPTFTPTYTESPVPAGALATSGFVVGPVVAAGGCAGAASGGFASIIGRDTGLASVLGCALGNAQAINAATQEFEGGKMIWVSSFAGAELIYVLYNNGTAQRYPDTWLEGVEPAELPDNANAPAGKVAPARGFGKVWASNPAVKSGLGWAFGGEQGTNAQFQRFAGGELLFVANWGQTLILAGQSWRPDTTPF
jgi:hypothetical protein